MKLQLIKLSGIAVLAVALLGSCRKGESDPFLSLRSRNARITGTWNLSSQITTSLNTSVSAGVTTVDSLTTSFDGTTLSALTNGITTTAPYSLTIEILKNGSYKSTLNNELGSLVRWGSWWWLNSKKRKVRIAFDNGLGSFHISRLKNKELVLMTDSTTTNTFLAGTTSSTSKTTSGVFTFAKQK